MVFYYMILFWKYGHIQLFFYFELFPKESTIIKFKTLDTYCQNVRNNFILTSLLNISQMPDIIMITND